jgi:hypothetical protein
VSKPTVTQQHASARAEQILRGTADAVTPWPTLEIYGPGSSTGPCLVDPNDTSDKRVQVTLTYWLRGIAPKTTPASPSMSCTTASIWATRLPTKSLGTTAPNIFAGTPSDDFLMSLQTSANGALSIGTTSPCIWPKGTPPAN